MKPLIRLTAIVGISLLLWACPKNNCPEGVDAVLRDYTGMDGCTWVIELPDGERLEPVNFHELEFTPEDNLPIRVSFTPAEEMMSICMVGKMVNIQCISRR